jgi:hypothetical protein
MMRSFVISRTVCAMTVLLCDALRLLQIDRCPSNFLE